MAKYRKGRKDILNKREKFYKFEKKRKKLKKKPNDLFQFHLKFQYHLYQKGKWSNNLDLSYWSLNIILQNLPAAWSQLHQSDKRLLFSCFRAFILLRILIWTLLFQKKNMNFHESIVKYFLKMGNKQAEIIC